MARKQNSQTISWFWDVYNRELLNLDPPYQRRSVWNQAFKDYFIDTILISFPAPAIFLHEEINPLDGISKYSVVDGKQRLTAIFEFIDKEFIVPDIAENAELRGKYFNELDDEVKKAFWGYEFSIEYVPSDQEETINNVFNRINRNTACLKEQELRHARYNGRFITATENLSISMRLILPRDFPNILTTDLRQMKDAEFISHLLLLLEVGTRWHYTEALDEAFSERDLIWEREKEVVEKFKDTIQCINGILRSGQGKEILASRLRNQTDFYSLFGAVADLNDTNGLPDNDTCALRLKGFTDFVSSENQCNIGELQKYYKAVKESYNTAKARKVRIEVLKKVLSGDIDFK